MIEKEQNTENGIKLASLAMDLNLTFTKYNRTNVENEELIERVAKAESNLEEKSEEIQKVNKKKNDYKMYVEQLADKNKALEEVLNKSEDSKHTEVKQMEQRIESRVAKIIIQKENMMKQEKALILEKYKQYEKKIRDQRMQLKEAHSLIQKLQHIGEETNGESYQNTVQKLVNSEKNLEQLKMMYHQLASRTEVLKKEQVIMEKKNRRANQKIKAKDTELNEYRKTTQNFKSRFRQLTDFISKKGGVPILNSLPNCDNYKPYQKSELEEFFGIKMREQPTTNEASTVG